jgi:ribosome biogenesis GTPase / thiamine phosphate phosphatase
LDCGEKEVLTLARKKPRKLRIAFRKNRQKRARVGDVTREVRKDDEETVDLPSVERISGKGDLTRHRTIMTDESGGGAGALRSVDPVNCRSGRVLSASGLNCVVADEAGGRLYECTVRRVVRTMQRDQRGAVVAGDSVLFHTIDREHGVIERINARRTTLARSMKRKEQVIAANISQALILASAANPALKTNLIDRLLISALKGGANPIICINKCDLVDPVRLQPIVGTYARLGYSVVLTSATAQIGIDELAYLLRGHQTVAAGQSGVGKSSLLNALQPGLRLETGPVSAWSQKGRHTTRTAVLHPLDSGGWVVDTPGIRQMDLWAVQPEEVEGFFPEFRPFVPGCHFPDCSHEHESGCAVKRAVGQDLISPVRYASYLRIMSGAES